MIYDDLIGNEIKCLSKAMPNAYITIKFEIIARETDSCCIDAVIFSDKMTIELPPDKEVK